MVNDTDAPYEQGAKRKLVSHLTESDRCEAQLPIQTLTKELWHVLSKHFNIAVAHGQVATKLSVVNRVLVFAGARPSNVE